ncbi:MAG: hypothetical protein LBE32_03465 [Burkholderiales bacterium]|jgi:hypothetical protein|nr:hypothetical protein [Burkholderiales bacterium]
MKIFIAMIILSFALLSNAMEVGSPAPQAIQPETKFPEARSTAKPQNSATILPDTFATIPDGSEKQKRIKELEKQMLDTVGWTTKRELGITRWPRTDRLYTLHKRLTDDDWTLLAEEYINFNYERKDYDLKELQYLESAMTILLAMRGQRAIETMNSVIKSKKITEDQKVFLYNKPNHVNELMETKYWHTLSEFKKDRQKKVRKHE